MSASLAPLPASGYATPHSAASSSSSLPASTNKAQPASKLKPVNVFTNDGSFLERFQRSKQEEEDKRKAEEALTKKKQFADRFKTRGKRPPPPDSSAVTSTGVDPNPVKRPKLSDMSQVSEYKKRFADAGRVHRDTGTNGPLVK